MKNLINVLAVVALSVVSITATAETELLLFGGNSTFSNSIYDTDTHSHDLTHRSTQYDSTDVATSPRFGSSDFAPGIGFNIRLGDSPVLLGAGVRNSDHLDVSYQLHGRYNVVGSKTGLNLNVLRYGEEDVRDSFGGDEVVGQALVTYDLFEHIRVGAGVTTATLDDQELSGLLSIDLQFGFSGNSTRTLKLPRIGDVVVPETTDVEPEVVFTGERG